MRQTTKQIIPIQKYVFWGKICCWITIFYNIGEGVASIVLGEEESSISLVAFGVQSFIETTSSVLVLIRFYYFEKHDIKERVCNTESVEDKETNEQNNNQQEEDKQKKFLKAERGVTITIGVFFIILSIVTIVVSSIALYREDRPDSTIDNIIISIIGLIVTVIFWYIKNKISKVLNSSAIAGDAACNLACIKLTIVLLIGSIIYTFWKGGWWIDSSMAIILALFFLKEGYQMLKWGLSKNFTGGCGDCCGSKQKTLNQNGQYSTNKDSKTNDCCKNDSCQEKNLQKNLCYQQVEKCNSDQIQSYCKKQCSSQSKNECSKTDNICITAQCSEENQKRDQFCKEQEYSDQIKSDTNK
ncbi:cation efflux family protein (macronuclear) [Tetrahymena thermophila SB210]|uniref:Cation efflux family protein n=1 Tax=Tetrahymena thermophila (strain SB210) TaxID=312017 RepID=W7XBX2_TETTS|nr:cation efflux family protein [Tetrahymena thermophila SB210]EWS73948.1 cation efflux family protein [Tetrahymena thermophila SB210]|eukprot:XP_012653489.1 cation efflux family protein [Tetrahymena thermophila SB210]